MAASSFLEHATQPVLTLIAVTPFAAYIASLKIGIGSFSDKPVVFIVALVSLPAFAFAAADGMRGADPSSRELLASVDASRWEVLWHLRLPSALPSLFTAAKYNTGLALVVAYLAERGTGGLGEIGSRAFAGQRRRPTVGGDLLDGDRRNNQPGAAERVTASGHGLARVTALADRLNGYGADDGRSR